VLLVLATLGVAASIGRALHVGDLAMRAEPTRQRLLHAFDRIDRFPEQRAAEVAQADGRFGSHRTATLWHVLPGGLFLALARAVAAIRAGRVAAHREWMIRAFAVALGISTVRLVAAALDLVVSPYGVPLAPLFVASLWIGWGVTVAAAELWIRYTRRLVG